MDRFEKLKEFKTTTQVSKNLDDDLREVQCGLDKLTEARDSLQNALEKNREKANKMWNSFNRILIASTKIESTTPDDLYDYYYYIPELDAHSIMVGHGIDGFRPDAIDLREFFINAGFSKTHKYYTNRRTIFCKNILRFIIGDLFSKHKYSSWEEVREDLIKIPETYPIPFEFESIFSYKLRYEELQTTKQIKLK